jgi:3-oxoacyl-[acyl-carrier protein] reductase
MAPLNGKVAIVTGSSSGIGRAIAERFAHDGAIVVVNYHAKEDRAKQVVTGILAKGGKAMAVRADVSAVSEGRRLVSDALQQFGQLDILVNNAGHFLPKPLAQTTEAEFDRIMALHAKGPYFLMQEAANVLKDGGRIVNISTAGTYMNFPGATAHLGSKAALEQFTRGLALELAPRGITVNVVSPGITDTGVLTDHYKRMGTERSPFRRLGTPKDIADVVAFIVSEEARWLTGQNIHADGGLIV